MELRFIMRMKKWGGGGEYENVLFVDVKQNQGPI